MLHGMEVAQPADLIMINDEIVDDICSWKPAKKKVIKINISRYLNFKKCLLQT